MSKKRIFLYVLIGSFILIQIYPLSKPDVKMENPNDIFINNDIPKNITSLLKSACYDCHSNETKYPWYSYVAPSKWLVYEHVKNGRHELNFSEWNTIKKADKIEILYDISEAVLEKEMPLKFYPKLHSDAKLTDDDREAISEWAEFFAEDLFE